MKLKIGDRIECPFCKAYAVKPPSKHIEDNPIWSLPNNSRLKLLEYVYNNARYLVNTATKGEFDKFVGYLPFEVSPDSFRDLEGAIHEYEELDEAE